MANKRSVDDVQELVVKIPTSALPLVEYAAKAQGWQPEVRQQDGTTAPNPVSAVAYCFRMMVQVMKANAVNAYASEKAEEARQTVAKEMDTAASEWIALMEQAQ